MVELRQSTSVTVRIGPFVDTDGAVVTGLTIQKADVRLSKNGGNYAAANADQGASDAGAPYDEVGEYDISLDATDTNTLGRLRANWADTGALPTWNEFMVISAAEWDRKYTTTGQAQLGLLSYGTAQSATGTTLVLAAAETYADDVLNGATLIVYGSTQGYFQSRAIVDYDLATDTATVDTWTVTPSGTISYWLFGTPPAVASGTLPAVNTVQVSDDAAAADTLELFAEALDQVTGQLDSGSFATGTVSNSASVSAALSATTSAATAQSSAESTTLSSITTGASSANVSATGSTVQSAALSSATAQSTADSVALSTVTLRPTSAQLSTAESTSLSAITIRATSAQASTTGSTAASIAVSAVTLTPSQVLSAAASAGGIEGNTVRINDTTVLGNGTAGNKWRG